MRAGLSGGLDSTVLLHVLACLRPLLGFELAACHVRHGLVSGSEAWADVCRALCDQLETQITTTTADSRRLLEAVLRDALAPVAA